MKKKIIIIVIILLLVAGGVASYFIFFNKKGDEVQAKLYSDAYDCRLLQGEDFDLKTEDVIFVSFVDNVQKEFTYTQVVTYKNKSLFDSASKEPLDIPTFLPIVDVDNDMMTITYHRDIYLKYKENSIEEYIQKLEGKGFECTRLEM